MAPEAVRIGYCKNTWCRRPLEYVLDEIGRVIDVPCRYCARLAHGRCYSCNGLLRPEIDRHHNGSRSRWHMRQKGVTKGLSCYEMRNYGAKLDGNRRYYRRNAGKERDRAGASYAKSRAEVATFNRKRRSARRREGAAKRDCSVKKTKPCPVMIRGRLCGEVIEYYTKPPKCCDKCWWKVAAGELVVPKEVKTRAKRPRDYAKVNRDAPSRLETHAHEATGDDRIRRDGGSAGLGSESDAA